MKFDLLNNPISGRDRLDLAQVELDRRGMRLGGITMNPELLPLSPDELDAVFHDVGASLEAFLQGDTTRVFMIDEPDENGWLAALEDAWNLADQAGNPELAAKLEEILEHLREAP